MKTLTAFAITFAAFAAMATVTIHPPLNADTLVGSWEAVMTPFEGTLWHMEIKEKGESYLAQIEVGARSCVVRSLISSQISDGYVRLHFGTAAPTESRGVESLEIGIVGKGVGIKTEGIIEASISNSNPENLSAESGTKIRFIKGTWTRDLAEASKHAEQCIKEQMAK